MAGVIAGCKVVDEMLLWRSAAPVGAGAAGTAPWRASTDASMTTRFGGSSLVRARRAGGYLARVADDGEAYALTERENRLAIPAGLSLF